MAIQIRTSENGHMREVYLRTSEDQVTRFLKKLPHGRGPQRVNLMPRGTSNTVPVTLYEAVTSEGRWTHEVGWKST